MAPVGASDGGNPGRMPGRRQPVVNGSANLAALDGRRAWPHMARDEEKHTLPRRDCSVEPAVDRPPGLVRVEPMQVEDPVGLDGT